MTGLVVCETVAAIVTHLRRADDAPIRLGGHDAADGLTTLCGTKLGGWDTRIPVSERSVTCRRCRVAAGMPEFMS